MRLLKNKNGMAYILTCVIVLLAMIMISVLFQFRTVCAVIETQTDAIQTKIDSVIMKSAIENYDALKAGSEYTRLIDYVKLEQDAYAELGFTSTSLESLERSEYTMYRPHVTAITENGFGVRVTYDLSVPFVALGHKVADITIPVTLTGRFTEK